MRHMTRFLSVLAAAVLAVLPLATLAQDGPLRIEITEGVIEPLPFAVPNFVAENTAAADMSQQLTRVVAQDLMGTGLFREIPPDAHIARITSFSSPRPTPSSRRSPTSTLRCNMPTGRRSTPRP